MTATRSLERPQASIVLRGVSLHGQPHALARPAPMTCEPVSQVRSVEPDHAEFGTQVPTGRSASDAAYEAGFAEGREEGYQAATALALAEARARDSALLEFRASATAEGRIEGMAQGREDARIAADEARANAAREAGEALANRLAQLDQLLQALQLEGARWLEAAEEDLVALSHQTVCRILGAEAAQPERLRSMVLHLLEEHGARAQLAVHVHPDDLAALAQDIDERETAWRWVGDTAVQLGGVVLRSREGSLDARLESQLGALADVLLTVRRERKGVALGEAEAVATTSATT